MKNILIVFTAIIIFTSCNKNDTVINSNFVEGKNRFTTIVDEDEREYYVHVPLNYKEDSAVPVVFMLHGTSGDGEKFYNNSGWKEVGDAENILTVFPSSWHYKIIEDGETLNTTKWNIFPGAFEYYPGENPRDDIKFLRQIIIELKSKFTIDNNKIYLVGFSNGGQMAFRCAVEMSDIFAAVVECAATYSTDTTLSPIRNIPVAFQLGNEDDRYFSSPVKLSNFETALNTISFFKNIVNVHTNSFQYQKSYTISGDTNTVLIATYQPINQNENRTFNMVLVKDLGHAYPNGENHWMHGAVQHWNWLKQFSHQ